MGIEAFRFSAIGRFPIRACTSRPTGKPPGAYETGTTESSVDASHPATAHSHGY